VRAWCVAVLPAVLVTALAGLATTAAVTLAVSAPADTTAPASSFTECRLEDFTRELVRLHSDVAHSAVIPEDERAAQNRGT
jgi:hypothetical protein